MVANIILNDNTIIKAETFVKVNNALLCYNDKNERIRIPQTNIKMIKDTISKEKKE